MRMPLARAAPAVHAAGNLPQLREELPLALAADAPIHRRTLIAVLIIAAARIEVSPGYALLNRQRHMINLLLEVEVIVLIIHDRLASVSRAIPQDVNLLGRP